jgi:hypothetical protein
MKNIKKIATLLAVSASLSFATSAIDKKVIDFQKRVVEQNPNFKLENLKIVTKKKISQSKGWYGYIINISLDMKGKKITVPETIFTNGSVITRELADMKTGKDLSRDVTVDFDSKDYSDSHIIAGNKNAKNKLVIFSDPHCPACVRFVPFVINLVKNRPNDMVLYYYHYPLNSIHPLAETIVKASLVAKKQGIKDVELKSYNANLTSKDITKEEALKEFNKKLGTSIKMSDLDKKWVKEQASKDLKLAKELALSGTPTLFINNQRDDTRERLQDLLAK